MSTMMIRWGFVHTRTHGRNISNKISGSSSSRRLVGVFVVFIVIVFFAASSTSPQESTSLSNLVGQLVLGWTRQLGYPLYVTMVVTYLTVRSYETWRRTRWERRSRIVPEMGLSASRGLPVPPITTTSTTTLMTTATQPIDLNGSFRLVSNDNFEALLAAQGVPWALRSAANRARPIHRIRHDGDRITIRIEGLIESESTYQIGGPPVEGHIRGRKFHDHVTYLTDERKEPNGINNYDDNDNTNNGNNSNDDGEGPDGGIDGDTANDHNSNNSNGIHIDEKKMDGDNNGSNGVRGRRKGANVVVGIQTTKRAVDDGYTVYVQRRLSPCGNQIIMSSRVEFDDTSDNNNKETVHSTQTFQRVS